MKATGKNFSCNNVKGTRKKSDFYETPYSLTRQFLQAEGLPENLSVLEPACGDGAITKVLQEFKFFKITSKDIKNGHDFLTEWDNYDAIITNPPFSLAFEFILHAKKIAPYFAFLLPLSYLHGKRRYDHIYCDDKFPLSRIRVFTRYPMLGEALREDGKYNTGMMVYAWFVWDKRGKSKSNYPEIHWLDNNHNVIGKYDKLADNPE